MQQTPKTFFGCLEAISAPKVLSTGRPLENPSDRFNIGEQVSRTISMEMSIASSFGMITSGMITIATSSSDLFASLWNKSTRDMAKNILF